MLYKKTLTKIFFMRLISLWSVLSLLLVPSSILEAKGTFREILYDHIRDQESHERALNYRKTKMIVTHKLKDPNEDPNDKEAEFQWDFYLFNKFLKIAPKTPLPILEEFKSQKEKYRFHKLSKLIELRSSYKFYTAEENVRLYMSIHALIKLNQSNSGEKYKENCAKAFLQWSMKDLDTKKL